MIRGFTKPNKQPLPDAPSLVPSSFLSDLLKDSDTRERLVVLDLGSAMASTVSFFGKYRCRLNCIDLYLEDFVLNPDQELTHLQKVELMSEALKLDSSEKINICLFWDIFSYLDDSLVRALIEALEGNVSGFTSALIINPRDSRQILPFCRYGVFDSGNLIQHVSEGEQPKIYPRSQRRLNSLIDYFEIDRGRLMSDGRAEYLLYQNKNVDKTNRSMI